MREPPLRPIGELLEGMLPPAAAGPAVGPVARAWPEAVGPAVAAAAWPARIDREGVLVVHCSSSLWVGELGFLQDELLAKLRASLGSKAPAGVRFRLGPMPRAAVAGRVARPPAEVPTPIAEEAGRLAGAIADPALRAAAAAAIARSLQRGAEEPSEGPFSR